MNERNKGSALSHDKLSPTTQALLDYLSFSEVKELLLRLTSLRSSLDISSIAVLSELPKEGKSFFCALLAAALTRMDGGKRCLIVDAGAHFPERSTLLDDTVEPLDNIDIVQIGESESNLAELMERVQGQYDLILIDTCALQRRNRRNLDPLLLARQAGGAILVSSQKSLGSDNAKAESRRLTDAGVKLLGIMHNQYFIPEESNKERVRGHAV
jgi:Mrp family chromosome partitioning ATPase